MVRVVANRLAAWLMDIASLGYYISVLAKAAAGVVPVEAIVAAYHAATKAKGIARRPGAIFCYTVNNYVKPPSPSEIRSPQARVGPPPPPMITSPIGDVSGPTMADISREEEIAELRKILLAKQSPFQALARLRLKEMNVEESQSGGPGPQ